MARGAALLLAAAAAVGAGSPGVLGQDPSAGRGGALEDLDRASRALVDRAGPAVVRVEAERTLRLRVVVDSPAERRTIEERLRSFGPRESVTFPGAGTREGSLVGEDPLAGVALVRVGPVEGVRAIRLSDREPGAGTLSLLLAPEGGEAPALHFGFITAPRRAFGPYDAYLVSSVPLTPGHAGAPLLDARGEALGMAVAPRASVRVGAARPPRPAAPALAGDAGQGGREVQNLGRLLELSRTVESPAPFATFVPAGELRRIVAGIRAEGRVRRAMLGVRLPPPAGEPLVLEVLPGTPAEKAGITAGDRVLAVDGILVEDANALTGFIQRRAAGTGVRLLVRAPDGGRREAEAVLAELPPPPRGLFNGLGVRDEAIAAELRGPLGADAAVDRCLVVRTVEPDSAAGRAGLREGDLVVSVDGVRLFTEGAYVDVATRVPADRESVEVVVLRDGERLVLRLK